MCGVKNCVMYKIKFYVVVFRSHFVYRSHVISLAKKKKNMRFLTVKTVLHFSLWSSVELQEGNVKMYSSLPSN